MLKYYVLELVRVVDTTIYFFYFFFFTRKPKSPSLLEYAAFELDSAREN